MRTVITLLYCWQSSSAVWELNETLWYSMWGSIPRSRCFLYCMYASELCLENSLAVPSCCLCFHLLLLVLLHTFSFLILDPFFQGKITLKKAAVSNFVFIILVRPLRSGKLMLVCIECFEFYLHGSTIFVQLQQWKWKLIVVWMLGFKLSAVCE